MRKRAIVTTFVAFVLLLAVVAAGLNAVFTITHVKTTFLTFSSQGEEDAKDLQKELNRFVGKSTTFLHLSDMSALVEKYPCLYLEAIGKKFPKTVELTVSERVESFSFRKSDGSYAVFDADGFYLHDSQDNISRTGGENIVLAGFHLTYSSGKRAEGEYFDAFMEAYSAMRDTLGVPRANINSIALTRNGSGTEARNNCFTVVTKEGVILEIYYPLASARKKVEMALDKYLNLGDSERMYGYITVTGTNDDDIRCSYSESTRR